MASTLIIALLALNAAAHDELLPAGPLLPSYPRYHFNFAQFPEVVNDPNAPLHHKGEYHYFFQQRPNNVEAVSIAHAVSNDMLHWKLLPPAIPAGGTTGNTTYDKGGAWSGGGFLLPSGDAGIAYRARGLPPRASGVAVAYASDTLLAEWSKLGVLFPGADGDGLPIWKSGGRWHGGGSIDTGANQHGSLVTYSSKSEMFSNNASGWAKDQHGLFSVVEQAPNWPGSTCCCPDFFPADPPGTASPAECESLTWSIKFSSYVHVPSPGKNGVQSGMLNTPDYFLLGEYDQDEQNFAAEVVCCTEATEKIARLFPADYGTFFASQTMWDPVLKRRILMAWIGSNNTHTIPREMTIVADEDDPQHKSIRLQPIRELVSLRNLSSYRGVHGYNSNNAVPLGPTPVPLAGPGHQQMDVVVTFTLDPDSMSGWQALASDNHSCSFGVELHRGGATSAPIRASVMNQRAAVNSPWDSPRLEKSFRNGAGLCTSNTSCPRTRASVLTLDQGPTSWNTTNVANLRILGGPFVLPLGASPLEMRILVDHALVEVFIGGGRAAVTAMAPHAAVDYDPQATGVALFSSCKGVYAKASLWEMDTAPIQMLPGSKSKYNKPQLFV